MSRHRSGLVQYDRGLHFNSSSTLWIANIFNVDVTRQVAVRKTKLFQKNILDWKNPYL